MAYLPKFLKDDHLSELEPISTTIFRESRAGITRFRSLVSGSDIRRLGTKPYSELRLDFFSIADFVIDPFLYNYTISQLVNCD